MRIRWVRNLIFTGVFFLCAACSRPKVVYESRAKDTEDLEIRELPTEELEAVICVYVCGEVKAPGVYELPADARLNDAVEAAGGMTEKAAQTFLNLAEYVKDGQKIEVPSAETAREWEEAARSQSSGLVNLNQASAEQLMTLQGIGEAKAKDILDYREEHGGFSDIEELMEIPGIKSGVFQRIKDKITI